MPARALIKTTWKIGVYRGYFKATARYEVYLREVMSEILVSPRQDKMHVFQPP